MDAANLLSNRSGDRQSHHNDLMDLVALAASSSLGRNNNNNNNENSRFSAANPLLAEKLLSPSLSVLDALQIGGGAVGGVGGGSGSGNSISNRSGRPPDMKGK